MVLYRVLVAIAISARIIYIDWCLAMVISIKPVCCLLDWLFTLTTTAVRQEDNVIKWKHFQRYWPLCGEFTVEFPSQRPVMRSFDVSFDPSLNKRVSKRPRRRWLETPSRSLWRDRNVKMGRADTVNTCIEYMVHSYQRYHRSSYDLIESVETTSMEYKSVQYVEWKLITRKNWWQNLGAIYRNI